MRRIDRLGLLGVAIGLFAPPATVGGSYEGREKTKASGPATSEARAVVRWQAPTAKGSREAIAEIAESPTPEATAALLALLDTADVDQRLSVLEVLTRRLPVPEFPDRECPFTELRTEERRQLSAKAWKSDFDSQARAYARWLLQDKDVRLSAYGARMITCVGAAEDTPSVIAAMDRILDERKDQDAKPSYMPSWFDPFLMASQGQTYRRAVDVAEPRTSGEIVIYLNKLWTHRDQRPEGWKSRCERWLKHPVPYIRHLAAFYLSIFG